MEDISGYGSSPERTIHRPPPPTELNDCRLSKRPRHSKENVQLPAVIPITLREDKYLVHVRLPISHPQLSQFVQKCLGLARLCLVGGPVKASFTELDDLHISIARPATVRSAQIGMLVSDLRDALSGCRRLQIILRALAIAFVNGNKRRVFVASPVAAGASKTHITRLIRTVDPVFKNHGLPEFFDDPQPHMSFAWTENIDVLPLFAANSTEVENADLEVTIDKVVCSIGKSSYHFALT